MSNVNVASLSREDLEAAYQLSQWALTWALHKLGGNMTITPEDMEDFNVTGRIYYSQALDDAMRGVITTVEFKEQEPVEESRIILPGTH